MKASDKVYRRYWHPVCWVLFSFHKIIDVVFDKWFDSAQCPVRGRAL